MVDLKVWGEYACFTRPEFKVERVSYPVITPSAARGVLEAIYWKPQMRYRIVEIGILKLGSQTSILRNEISDRQAPPPKGKAGGLLVEEKRQQRSSLVLRDVCYRIKAWIDVRPDKRQDAAKHPICFNRRVERGECFHRPYLGCREFVANFEAATPADVPNKTLNMEMGAMLFDIAYCKVRDNGRVDLEFYQHEPGDVNDTRRAVAGVQRPLMLLPSQARVEGGWLRVPREKYAELDNLEGRQWVS